MFLLILALLMLILLGIVIFMVFIGVVAIVSAMVGGTTVAVLVKNKTAKKLLFIGVFTLFLIGTLCIAPIIIAYLSLPAVFIAIASIFTCLCIMVLSIAGIKLSLTINNKIGKTILIILFCIILVAAVALFIFTALGSYFFTHT